MNKKDEALRLAKIALEMHRRSYMTPVSEVAKLANRRVAAIRKALRAINEAAI